MSIAENIRQLESQLTHQAHLIAVTKTQPVATLLEAYNAGCRRFGENKVQEMVEKAILLPTDIDWHMIGHLQTNKVKYIAPFVALIHSVDSLKLLCEINKQAMKNGRTIPCLLQIYIAREETKFGLDEQEAEDLLRNPVLDQLTQIRLIGLMGLASATNDETQLRQEFRGLKRLYDRLSNIKRSMIDFRELSMGMSGDFRIAVEEGSTMVRVGSALFGTRK